MLKRARADTVQKGDAAGQGGGASDQGQGTGALLARARRHAEQAQAFLRKKQYADAQREMRAATEVLGQASREVRDGGAGALAELRGTLKSLSDQAEALWQRQDGKESEEKP